MMDLCQRTFQNDAKKMIHSRQDSKNDLRSFSFGSFQSTLMTSCVPSFKCGPLEKTCGSSGLVYSRERKLSHSVEEADQTNEDYSSLDGNKSNRNSCTDFSTNNTKAQDSSDKYVNKIYSTGKSSVIGLDSYSNSEVVITQPTSGDTSCNENSTFIDNDIETKLNLNNTISSRQSEKQLEESGNQKSYPPNASALNKCSDYNCEHHSDELVLKQQSKEFSKSAKSESVEGEPFVLLTTKTSSFKSTMKAEGSHHQQQGNQVPKDLKDDKESSGKKCATSEYLGSGNSQYPKKQSSSSTSTSLHKDLKRSPNKKSSKTDYNSHGYSFPDETQKLFTPEDLSNEDMKPNPQESKSEIYQNLNAREAGFVLHKPKRKPRKVPLPSTFMVTVSLNSDVNKVRHGLIEPLATEDEVALQEGAKEVMENGILSGLESTFYNSYDFSPYEAVNFVLENSIDNFDREEYVQFKRAKGSDLKVPNISESSYLVQSFIIKPENKMVQFDNVRNKKMVNNSQSDVSNNIKDYSLQSNTNSVPNSTPDKSCAKRNNGNNISQIGTDRMHQESKRLSAGEHTLLENRIADSGDNLCRDNEINLFGEREKEVDKPHFNSPQSFKSASKRTRNEQSVFPTVSTSYDPFSEELMTYENLDSACKSRHQEKHKLKSDSALGTNERPRHKRSTKLYKNIKYYKITNHDQSSLENDSSENLSKEEDVRKKSGDSYTALGRQRRRLPSRVPPGKQENPLLLYGNKETPKTTMDILEEVQANLRARLASLEDLDALAEDIADGSNAPSKARPIVPYKPLVDLASSFTPPSSSSPSSMRDWFSSTGATRKDKRRQGRTKKRGRRECGGEEPSNTSKTLHKRPSPSWSSSSSSSSSSTSSSSSSSDESSLSLNSPKSSSMAASSSSSSSSSSDSSTSSIESSDIEDSLI